MDRIKMEERLLRIFTALRFPLAVMVVFIHLGSEVDNIISDDTQWETVFLHNIYEFIRVLIPKIICQIAVPLFFLISGYLFFFSLRTWNWNIWQSKIHRRIHTLLIPYILWSFLRFLLRNENISFNVDTLSHILWHDSWTDAGGYISWLGTYISISVPVHVAFWFIRDLIILTILSPCIYYAIKRLGSVIIIMLGLAYISSIWPTFPGQSIRSVFFYSLGAWISIKNIDVLGLISKYRDTIIFTPPILISLLLAFNEGCMLVRSLFLPLFVLSAIPATIRFTDIMLQRYNNHFNTFLAGSSFFIYAAHMIVLQFLKDIQMYIPNNIFVILIWYFVYPVIDVIICLGIYWTVKRHVPMLCKILTGK